VRVAGGDDDGGVTDGAAGDVGVPDVGVVPVGREDAHVIPSVVLIQWSMMAKSAGFDRGLERCSKGHCLPFVQLFPLVMKS